MAYDVDLNGTKVLVVEDETLVACDIMLALQDAGAVVIGPAPTVQSALELIDRSPPEAAVLDVRLGADHVSPVARALHGRGVPFVFHTGHANEEMLGEWPQARVVRKPADPSVLITELARLLDIQPRQDRA